MKILHKQLKGTSKNGSFDLSVKTGIRSPYYRNSEFTDRIKSLILYRMTNVRAYIITYIPGGSPYVIVAFIDSMGNNDQQQINFNINSTDTIAQIKSNIMTVAQTYASSASYTIIDWVWFGEPTLGNTSTLSVNSVSRSLNSAFQISSVTQAFVHYSVDIASTLSLTTGQTGTVVLEYADNSGFTTGVTTVQSSDNGNTGTLAIGLGLVQTIGVSVGGVIPAAKYVRIRTVNTTGTPTFTYKSGQEAY